MGRNELAVEWREKLDKAKLEADAKAEELNARLSKSIDELRQQYADMELLQQSDHAGKEAAETELESRSKRLELQLGKVAKAHGAIQGQDGQRVERQLTRQVDILNKELNEALSLLQILDPPLSLSFGRTVMGRMRG